MCLLKTLWQRRHIAALNALTSTDENFWMHLVNPISKELNLQMIKTDRKVTEFYKIYDGI